MWFSILPVFSQSCSKFSACFTYIGLFAIFAWNFIHYFCCFTFFPLVFWSDQHIFDARRMLRLWIENRTERLDGLRSPWLSEERGTRQSKETRGNIRYQVCTTRSSLRKHHVTTIPSAMFGNFRRTSQLKMSRVTGRNRLIVSNFSGSIYEKTLLLLWKRL